MSNTAPKGIERLGRPNHLNSIELRRIGHALRTDIEAPFTFVERTSTHPRGISIIGTAKAVKHHADIQRARGVVGEQRVYDQAPIPYDQATEENTPNVLSQEPGEIRDWQETDDYFAAEAAPFVPVSIDGKILTDGKFDKNDSL